MSYLFDAIRDGRWYVFFTCIAIVNSPYLFEPPCWDFLTSMFAQAYWLANHGLDYRGLLNQPDWLGHGPRTYPTAWLPSFAYAMALSAEIPPRWIAAAIHLTNWLGAAVALSVVFRLIKQHATWQLALLTSIAVLTTPLFLAQSAACGVEGMLLGLHAGAFYLCMRRRYVAATALVVLAYHMHPRGVLTLVACSTLLSVDLASALLAGRPRDARRLSTELRRGLAALGLASGLFVFYIIVRSQLLSNERPLVELGSGMRLHVTYLLIPELLVAVLYFAICALCAAIIGVSRRLGRRTDITDGATDPAATPIGLFLRTGCCILTFALFYANFSLSPCPRYFLVIYPLLAVGLVAFASAHAIRERFVVIVLVIGIAWNLVNHDGRFYLPITGNNGGGLERSGEYHDLVRLHETLVADIQKRFDPNRVVIVAGWPSLHALTFPEAGYSASGEFTTYSPRPLTYASMGTLDTLYRASDDGLTIEQISDKEIVWVHDPNSYTAGVRTIMEPLHGRDAIVTRLRVGTNAISLFRRPRRFGHRALSEYLSPPEGSPYGKLPPHVRRKDSEL